MTEPNNAAPAPHPELLITRMASMARELRGTGARTDRSFDDVVATAAQQTVALVSGIDHAAVAVIAVDRRSADNQVRYATDDVAAELTFLQLDSARGPVPQRPREVTVTDLDSAAPEALAAAARRHGVGAVMTMPLFVGARSVGVLTGYAAHVDLLDDDALATGAAVATHVALAALSLGEDASLRTALASRDVIGQAKGILMERYDIDAGAAFDLVAQISQQDNRRLVTVAADVVTTRRTSVDTAAAESATADASDPDMS